MAHKDTSRGHIGSTYEMLEVCDVQFQHLNDQLDDIKASITELRPHLFNLPTTIGTAVRQHMHDCPAYSRALHRVVRPSDTPSRGTAVLVDSNSPFPRIPRWVKYLLGVGSILGGVIVAILQYYGLM